ncbi:MAG: hypothetical protein H6537_01740 [Bacteroidales bacterium]|nr:hypothetical protein [Bacteroidales bacterium]
MSRQVKIWLFILTWLAMLVYLVYALNFSKGKTKDVVCKNIRVDVLDSSQFQMVKATEIRKRLLGKEFNLIGKPLNEINTSILEDELSQIAAVRNVEVFKTANGTLCVNVEQRIPIVRVFNAKNQSYYIDNEGSILPFRVKLAANVLIVNGNIHEPFAIKPNMSVLSIPDSASRNNLLIKQIFQFARFINSNSFWKAQVSQLYVNNSNNIELVPTVGPHIVLLGNLTNFKNKLAKLELLYKKALPVEGWNKYSIINLKYSNQIVCTKR